MLYVSPFVEGLRAHPRLVFWTVAFAQALLWTLVPVLFYASPPGDLPVILAVGHEWQAGSIVGPPLSAWLAEIAFNLSGGHVFGIYLLAQVCVVTTFWAVFALGRAIVGTHHAVLAVLLMFGVFVFSAPSSEFGRSVAAMPLAALLLLHLWRAIGEGKPRYWFAAGLWLGFLFLASYSALIVAIAVAIFIAATEGGRRTLGTPEPWAGLMLALLIASPHLIWLSNAGALSPMGLHAAAQRSIASPRLGEWLQLVGTLVVIHLGLALLAAAAAVTEKGRPEVPAIARQPVGDFAKSFVYFFALAPAFAGVVASVLSGRAMIIDGAGPLVVLSGLAVVVAAGDVIQLRRPRVLAWIWAASLIAPALATVAAIVLLPWTLGVALPVNQPSQAMASFFTDAFNRRTGKPLAFVIGDARLGGLIALGSANRPSLMIDGLRERSPWISDAALRESGALAVWPLRDALGATPSVLRARYPHLTAEVPRGFERPIQGLLPLFRVGWAIMRPQQGGAAADRKR